MGKIMDAVKNKLQSWLEINDTSPKAIVINRNEDLHIYQAKNRIWYNGDSDELEQFYKQLNNNKSLFWASVPAVGLGIRKIHTGLPQIIINKITDIVIDNYNGVEINDVSKLDRWNEIADDNHFDDLLWDIIAETLYLGDGAIRYSYDPNISKDPILEWISGDRCEFIYKRGRLYEIIFTSYYEKNSKKYKLLEIYGYGYIKCELYDGKQMIDLKSLKETENLKAELNFDREFMCAVPFFVDKNSKYKGRGASKFNSKYDLFDALDEIISQWVEAIRQGKPVRYIPESLLPRNPNTGEVMKPNGFDNSYIETEADMKEGSQNKITVVQSEIYSDKYYQAYVNCLELCLQGIISPSTLGIDTKKIQDPNSSYERQMEKTTLYTRQGIIESLNDFIPKVINGVLNFQKILEKQQPEEDIEINVNFGEYDSPSFDSQIDTITKAKNGGIMSIETSIKELYGDSKDEEWIDEEILRLKEEQGITEMEEPSINQDLDLDVIDNETNDKSNTANVLENNK